VAISATRSRTLRRAVERVGSGLICDEFVVHLMMNFPICPEISGENVGGGVSVSGAIGIRKPLMSERRNSSNIAVFLSAHNG
jgi:hypothetical protein